MAVRKGKKSWKKPSRYFGVGAKSFSEAFPEIEKIDVVVVDTNPQAGESKTSTYGMADLVEQTIECGHPKCIGGGFSIGLIVREMVKAKQIKDSRTISCEGVHGSKMGRSLFGPCRNVFEIKTTIKYRPPAAKKAKAVSGEPKAKKK